MISVLICSTSYTVAAAPPLPKLSLKKQWVAPKYGTLPLCLAPVPEGWGWR